MLLAVGLTGLPVPVADAVALAVALTAAQILGGMAANSVARPDQLARVR